VTFWNSALSSGYSVTPISQAILDGWQDGSKNYTYKWRTYQAEAMPQDVAAKEFAGVPGMATICGSASGNLLVIDIDVPSYYELFLDLLRKNWPRLSFPAVVRTPSGGYHLYIRMKGGEVPPNQKLAHDVDGDSGEIQIAIETRGQGGLVYAPPTPGYEWLSGGLDKVPVWDAERVAQILTMARTLDMAPERTVPEAMPHDKPRKAGEGDRPGDVANTELVWRDLLERDGWLHIYDHGGRGYYRRPGKDGKQVGGVTGLGRGGQDLLYVFSTNAPVPEGLHSKFHYIAITKHGGDYGAATKALAEQLGVIRFRPEVVATVEAAVQVEVMPKEPATFALTDIGNAERMWAWLGRDLRWVPEWKQFVIWDGKRWNLEVGGGERAIWMAVETVRRMYADASELPRAEDRGALAKWAIKCESRSRIANMVELIKSVPGCAVASGVFDTQLNLLNAANGTINLTTGELLPWNREDYMTIVMDTEYEPGYGSDLYYNTAVEVFDGDMAMVNYFFTALGYSLCGTLNEQCLFFLYGSGSNGKSIMLNAAMKALGPYAGVLSSEVVFDKRGMGHKDTTGLAQARGKRIISVTETSEGAKWSEDWVKGALDKRDRVTVRQLYKDEYSYEQTWVLWVRGNHKPVVRGNDDGIWRRMRLIPFERTFEGSQIDKQLADKMDKEASGILGLMVHGYRHYVEHGLVTPDKVSSATDEYREDMDTLGAFLNECTTDCNSCSPLLASDLYNVYQRWCSVNGQNYVMPNRTMIGRLRERGWDCQKSRDGVKVAGMELSVRGEELKLGWGRS